MRESVQMRGLPAAQRAGRLARRLGMGALVDHVKHRVLQVPSDFEVEFDGLRMGGTSLGQLAQVRAWGEGRKEPCFSAAFCDAVGPGATVLDVGAYVGWFTLLAARGAGPRGRVIALEPHPVSARTLRANVARNGFADRVAIVEAALGDVDGRRSFFLDAVDESESGLDRTEGEGHAIDVRCLTADAVLRGAPVNVVKIDVEGHEVEVLEGLRDTLRRSGDPVLFVELNPAALQAARTPPADLLALLGDLGFTLEVIDEATGALSPPAEGFVSAIEPGGYANLRCRRRRRHAREVVVA